MNKKLILLILVLPLFLMLSIYTSTNSVGLNVLIPVSKIEISDDKFVYLNLDDEEKYFINYSVYPTTASNKKVVFSTEQYGNDRLAEIEYKDGYIIPKTVGSAKVSLTTIDGGYKDSFVVKVESINLHSIECSVETTELMIGTSTRISTTFVPETFNNKSLTYTSSNEAVATVNSNGLIRGVGKGSAVITVASKVKPSVKQQIVVNVYNQDIIDLVQTQVYTIDGSEDIGIYVDTTENFELSYKLYDVNNNLISEPIFDEENTKFIPTSDNQVLFDYAFKNAFNESYENNTFIIRFTITTDNEVRDPFSKDCVVHRVGEFEASYKDDNVLCYTAGDVIYLHDQITIDLEDIDVRYEVEELTNTNIEVIECGLNTLELKAALPGVTEVKVNVVRDNPYQCVTLQPKKIVILPSDLNIEETTELFGIENIFTVGKVEADGNPSISKLNISTGKTEQGSNFLESFNFYTNTEKVSIDKNGVISILDEDFTGLVETYAEFSSNGYTVKTQPFTFRAVGEGVNVRNFDDLYKTTKAEKVVVLHAEIKDDFGYDAEGKAVYTEQTIDKINSTYDITYYENVVRQKNPGLSESEILRIAKEQSQIKVLINFKADVYGNGHIINAHNVAYGLDSTDALKDNALFRGPNSFVALTDSEGSAVSVKAQDNVCFAVYENVNINNVELWGCELKNDNGNYDLTDLDYVGTTVEVFGDNVNINYSRLMYGRTVLRAFGDINDSSKVINLNVNNSVLRFAREFIVRLGSNCFVDGTKEVQSPYLDSDTTLKFPVQKDYEYMSQQEKQAYDNKYIKTFVKFKDSVLRDCGLFCIGLDSHFSGAALADGSGFAGGLISTWYDLAKTSYGVKLTFEGDVRMYAWKNVEEIDSSTLIQVDLADGIRVEDFEFSKLKFDVKEMINNLADNPNDYINKIVYSQNGKRYVHGGIAFFGGGKNYSVYDYDPDNYDFYVLNGYQVKLSDVNRTELQLAAGNEPFYFLLNDANTYGFLPDDQVDYLAGVYGSAEQPIYNKD